MVAPLDLIPEHIVLSESKAKEVSKKYNIPFEKFAKILVTDPQSKALGAKPGDLIEIRRADAAGKYVTYRYVVKG